MFFSNFEKYKSMVEKCFFCIASSVFKERFYFCIFHLLDPDPEGLPKCGTMRFYTSETDAWFKGLTS